MSLSSPASSIPRWLLPHRRLHAWPASTAASTLRAHHDLKRARGAGCPHPNTFPSPRSYATRKPKRSPAARRATLDPTSYGHVAEPVRDTYTVDGLLQNPLSDWDLEAAKRAIIPRWGALYTASVKDGFLSEDVSFASFKQIAMSIMEVAAQRAPTASVLELIGNDPSVIFHVGHVISIIDPRLRAWVISATARAGVYTPIVITAARALKATRGPPSPTPIFARVESWAMQRHDPRCMLVHAQVLGRREQFEEALRLVQWVMRSIQPVYTRPGDPVSLALDTHIEPPWETYRWLTEKKKEREGPGPSTPSSSSSSPPPAAGAAAVSDQNLDAVTEMAALVYQDPAALVRYAQVMFQSGQLDAYEEHLNQAAAAGNVDACRKLANFYYMKSQGRFSPKREKATAGTSSADESHIDRDNDIMERAPTSTEFKPESELKAVSERPKPERGQAPNNDNTNSVISSILSTFTSLFTRPDPRDNYSRLAFEWYKLAYQRGCSKSALIFAILARRQGDPKAGLESLALAQQDSRFLRLASRMRDRWEDGDYEPEIPTQLLDT